MPPRRRAKSWEMFRGAGSGLEVRDLTAEVTALRQQSKTGQAFKTALEAHGYQLVSGRRGLLILDRAGHEHSLARRCGVPMKQVLAFMGEVELQALPTVEQARAQHRDGKRARTKNESATPVWPNRELGQTFLAGGAPEPKKGERRAGKPERGQFVMPRSLAPLPKSGELERPPEERPRTTQLQSAGASQRLRLGAIQRRQFRTLAKIILRPRFHPRRKEPVRPGAPPPAAFSGFAPEP